MEKEIINKTLSVIGNSIYWICLAIIIVYTVGFLTFMIPIKLGLENLDKISALTQEYKVSWIYMCPDYVHDYYNCNNTRFMNLTGKYCNDRLVCENKYIISNKS